ncbi:MAG: GtrA family protein [Ignavibacteriales bacterium]|nr:GtrA family protein [Ignavibacteriales bacterium]
MYKKNSALLNYFHQLFTLSPNTKTVIQPLRFVITGAFTVSIDLLILFLLYKLLNVNYLVAAAFGFLVGSLINYLISIRWVFINGKYRFQSLELTIFLLTSTVALLLNQLVIYVSVEKFSLPVIFSKGNSIVVVTVFNFLSKKFIVFKG